MKRSNPEDELPWLNSMKPDVQFRLQRKLARAEYKLAHIDSLISNGTAGWLTYMRLNMVCRRIEQLQVRLKRLADEQF
jgi:hypothetical protein